MSSLVHSEMLGLSVSVVPAALLPAQRGAVNPHAASSSRAASSSPRRIAPSHYHAASSSQHLRTASISMTSAFERENMFLAEMKVTAKEIARRGCGILATDESHATVGKRLSTVGVENTPENRRRFRELLYTTEGLGKHLSGVIMYDETLYQRTSGGVRFVQVLRDEGIQVGIKVDTGLAPLGGGAASGETSTQGLDGLSDRCKAYYAEGARFAKWRAVFKMGRGTPSRRALSDNAHSLARFASICQENGLVPIVEPELTLGPGDYDIEEAAHQTERVLSTVFRKLNAYDVVPEAMLLKPGMVLPGLDAAMVPKEDVAKFTARSMMRTVPPAVPGIHFLSGGMGAEEATSNLQALQRACPNAPWSLSFSFGRALQDSVLKTWAGDDANADAAQTLLRELARVNGEAQAGEWNEEHPSPGGGRVLLPKLSYSSERRKPSELFNW